MSLYALLSAPQYDLSTHDWTGQVVGLYANLQALVNARQVMLDEERSRKAAALGIDPRPCWRPHSDLNLRSVKVTDLSYDEHTATGFTIPLDKCALGKVPDKRRLPAALVHSVDSGQRWVGPIPLVQQIRTGPRSTIHVHVDGSLWIAGPSEACQDFISLAEDLLAAGVSIDEIGLLDEEVTAAQAMAAGQSPPVYLSVWSTHSRGGVGGRQGWVSFATRHEALEHQRGLAPGVADGVCMYHRTTRYEPGRSWES